MALALSGNLMFRGLHGGEACSNDLCDLPSVA